MTTTRDTAAESLPMLEAIMNLSRYHRDHERFYASAPRERAVELQRHARTLQALADRWTLVEPDDRQAFSPFEGADDLNDGVALQLDGVLFMAGEGRPAEITALIRDLRAAAEDFAATGDWLANAMRASWEMAGSLIAIDALADVLGERHRIISNDWLAAAMNSVLGQLVGRAAEMLDHIDFTPAAVRADLARDRVTPARLYSAAELLDRAADLCCESAGLVHDNERRWRTFRARVAGVVAGLTA